MTERQAIRLTLVLQLAGIVCASLVFVNLALGLAGVAMLMLSLAMAVKGAWPYL